MGKMSAFTNLSEDALLILYPIWLKPYAHWLLAGSAVSRWPFEGVTEQGPSVKRVG